MQVKNQQLEPDMGQRADSKSGKEYVKAIYCHPAYLTYMQSTSCEMPGWMKHKLKSRLLEETSITQIHRWHHPYGRKQRTKEPLNWSERGEWKSWLKTQHSENEDHGIQSHHCMANRWKNNGNSDRLYLLGSKITVDGDCSHEIKRYLLLGRKVMKPRQDIKSRDITLPTKVHLVKLWFFQ